MKVILAGGLGNQLFQAFSAIAQAQTQGIEFLKISRTLFLRRQEIREFGLSECIDLHEGVPKIFNVRCEFHDHYMDTLKFKIGSRLPKSFALPLGIGNDQNPPRPIGGVGLLAGYFQSKKLLPSRNLIRQLFNRRPAAQNTGFAVHLRRGDYLLSKNNGYGVVSSGAIYDLLKDRNAFDLGVTIFSDGDIRAELEEKWDRNDIKKTTFARDFSLSTIDEFYLMRSYENIVCSNSTFSWWAAFSSEQASRIFLPKMWTKAAELSNWLYFDGVETYDPQLE